MDEDKLKSKIFQGLTSLKVEKLFQYLNRRKIVIVAYHAVTNNSYKVFPWTHIHSEDFENQIRFFSENYQFISLSHLVTSLALDQSLPKRSMVLTFDDGYRNNYTIALPILRKYRANATIFLTTGYVDKNEILPMDRAFLDLYFANKKKTYFLPDSNSKALNLTSDKDIIQSYNATVAFLKKYPTVKQEKYLECIRNTLMPEDYKNNSKVMEDFVLMSWEEVIDAYQSGFVEFGAHTVSHEILTNLSIKMAEQEILRSKEMIEKKLNKNVNLFAFPNGTPSDYSQEHINILKNNGFIGAVCTISKLNTIQDDSFQLGRLCIGSDFSSNPHFLALRTAGFVNFVAQLKNVFDRK